ncbi:MAG: UDP-N-acetylmuramoyl-L-alanine--D-glutamate ligase, partial [Planctomycetes bacterium]|nr:UDP-N-acetylmuramoyl-L-alanine--D-glutamate ligase [Planctomycetota bacterium]
RGRRAVVMGLGLFSGGVEAARWLAARGARVLVTDEKDAAALAPSVKALEGLPLEWRLGGHDPADFDGAALVVASPAVPRDHPLLARAAAGGAALETEVGLFLRACPARVTAVTGSNGKSTTAALAAAMIGAAGRTVHLGGNIGRALVNRAEAMAPGDEVVLEISSFQLEWTGPAGLFPRVGLVTNVTPNHLDRHGTFEAYLGAKAAVLPPGGEGRAAILAHDDEGARSLAGRARCRVVWTALEGTPPGESVAWRGETLAARLGGREEAILRRGDVPLRGRFNLRNAASAAAAALLAGAPAEAVREACRSFRGLPHRLEDCGDARGVLCVNDSKATTPEAALRGLGAFEGRPVVMIAGGYDKKVDLAPFAAEMARRCAGVVLLGATADLLEGMLRGAGLAAVARASSMEEAVERGLALSPAGGVLLLSPGHASYGMFTNYEERGDRFRAAVASRRGV